MTKLTLLGGLSPKQFLRDYWHKQPLLIRQAIPGFKPLLARETVVEMASRDDVESRLITHFANQWRLEHGPITKMPPFSKKGWTLLIQGVNLHHDDADALMQQFRFIPDARLDDLMISYATDGGGVGPHFDSYDVFLLQAYGRRKWRISSQKDFSLVEDLPLKILKNFIPEQEFVLEPGDMLYLPPHFAHDGIALGECMTYSIGFRAPEYQELGEAFLQFMSDSIDLPGRYADPELTVTRHPAELSRDMLNKVQKELEKIRFTEDDIVISLGEYLTEPKSTVFFDIPEKPVSENRFLQRVMKKGVALDRKSKMLYRGKHIFINGESFSARAQDKPALIELADSRRLNHSKIAETSQDVLEALYAWYKAGWLSLP